MFGYEYGSLYLSHNRYIGGSRVCSPHEGCLDLGEMIPLMVVGWLVGWFSLRKYVYWTMRKAWAAGAHGEVAGGQPQAFTGLLFLCYFSKCRFVQRDVRRIAALLSQCDWWYVREKLIDDILLTLENFFLALYRIFNKIFWMFFSLTR